MTGENAPEKELFDQYADHYSAEIDKSLGAFGTEHDFFTRHKAWLIAEILSRAGRTARNMTLLDVGCGVGKIHDHLKNTMGHVTGVDVSTESIRMARQAHADCDYQDYDGQNLPFANDRFDMAMAICVFHHIPVAQWHQVASEMLRVVKPHGLVLVIEHNPFNPVTRYVVNSCSFDADAVLLSPRRLRKLFSLPLSSKVASRSMLNIPPISGALRRLDLAMGRIPMGAQHYMIAEKCSPA